MRVHHLFRAFCSCGQLSEILSNKFTCGANESASDTCSRGPSDDANPSWVIGCFVSQGQKTYMLVPHSLVANTLRWANLHSTR
jgi:hypothetical protein